MNSPFGGPKLNRSPDKVSELKENAVEEHGDLQSEKFVEVQDQ